MSLHIPALYHGSAPPETHAVIAKHSSLHDGVCLNLKNGFKPIAESFKMIETYKISIFIDNGSIERFNDFLAGRISEVEYKSEVTGTAFFKFITGEYEKLLRAAKYPENILVTVPEVVGASRLSINLQEKFMPRYDDLQKQYHFQMIIALQFNARSLDWIDQMHESVRFIASSNAIHASGTRIGIPFGEDFKRIQNAKDFALIDHLFINGTLKRFKAHMFALGSPLKHERFAKGREWIASCDASTIFQLSFFASYVSRFGYIFDKRDIKGEAGRNPEKVKQIREIMTREKIDWNDWTNNRKYNLQERFRVNLANFDFLVKGIYEGRLHAKATAVSKDTGMIKERPGKLLSLF